MNQLNQKLLARLDSKQAIIWDFDGVLVFTDWNYGEDLDEYRERLWQLLEKFDPQIRQKIAQRSYPYEHTDYIVEEFGQKALDEINDFYLKKELSIAPGAKVNEEILKIIQHDLADKQHFIWSNNQFGFVEEMLGEKGYLSLFEEIASRDRYQLAKPNLDGFDLIKTKLKTSIEQTIFVGDSQRTDKIVAEKLGVEFFYYV